MVVVDRTEVALTVAVPTEAVEFAVAKGAIAAAKAPLAVGVSRAAPVGAATHAAVRKPAAA
jgi:hypothetical protein